jgi:hypothetical protein
MFGKGLLVVTLVASIFLGCFTQVFCADDKVSELIPLGYTDADWENGIVRPDGKKGSLPGPGILLVSWDKKKPVPVKTGDILVFAKSGAATIVNISQVPYPTSINLFISVNKPLDPAGDGNPNKVAIVQTR